MKICNLPKKLKMRIEGFNQIQWKNHYQMNQTEILHNLPLSL